MIAMVEGAKRQKTPNEIALTILLVALTLSVPARHGHAAAVTRSTAWKWQARHAHHDTALIALLVCLIPTTIGALLSAIGVAGMSRMMQANVIATSGPRSRSRQATWTCCCSTRRARSRLAIGKRLHSSPRLA